MTMTYSKRRNRTKRREKARGKLARKLGLPYRGHLTLNHKGK